MELNRVTWLYSEQSNITIDDCEFIDNIVIAYGALELNSKGVVTVQNSVFANNVAGEDFSVGAGLNLYSGQGGHAIVKNNLFANNTERWDLTLGAR